ncbi:MAG: hypothetical protein Q8761_02285 [Sweet potato little leaf phytoplasma]|nr:hypothetical protein [Sweet potato little leaf phytoplasma]
MGDVLTYQPSSVKITIQDFILTGVTGIALAWGSPAFKPIRGMNGYNTRVASLDESATIRVSLLQTSIANQVLHDIVQQDRQLRTGRLAVTLKDQVNGSIYSSDAASIITVPDIEYTEDFNDWTWEIWLPYTTVTKAESNSSLLVDVFNQFSF